MIEVVKEIIILYTIVHPLSGCPVWERQHKYNTMNPIWITILIVRAQIDKITIEGKLTEKILYSRFLILLAL